MLRRALMILVVLAAPVLGGDDFEPFLAHVDGLLREDRSQVVSIVRELERRPLPPSTGRSRLVEGLVGLLTARGEDALARRVRALPVEARARTLARAATALAFPSDHGAHPESFCEWWYFTGNLTDGSGRWGFEVSFFRTMVGIHFVHTALTDVARSAHPWQRYYVKPRNTTFAREHLETRMGENSVRENERGELELRLNARGNRLALTLKPERAPMIVNGDGVIDMPEGTTSRYYSFTRLATTGTLTTADGRRLTVSGRSWFDHQWGNFVAFFRPWDWFSFQMADGSDYNLFHFREYLGAAGRTDVNVLRPDDRLEVSRRLTLAARSWWKSPRTGGNYVMRWLLTLPGAAGTETFDVTTPVADQEMPRANIADLPPVYWEGAIDVVRTARDGTATRGVGYSEHMPYRRPVRR